MLRNLECRTASDCTLTSTPLTNLTCWIPHFASSTNFAKMSSNPLSADISKMPPLRWSKPRPSEPYDATLRCSATRKAMPDSEMNSRTTFEEILPFLMYINLIYCPVPPWTQPKEGEMSTVLYYCRDSTGNFMYPQKLGKSNNCLFCSVLRRRFPRTL